MNIHFNGGAGTVTGSQFLIEVNNKRLLLDCGLYQGKRDESLLRNRGFAFNPAKLDAVILSHAHIDHSGNLPNLVKQGYNGPIYATEGTVGLADLMLRDSAHIQESDAEYMNRKRAKRGQPLIEPIYTVEDAEQVIQLFQGLRYNEIFSPVEGVTAHLVDAGHILGSSSVVLDIEEDHRKFRLWFSGDIGRYKLPLMRDPVLPSEADYLMMECTYGDKVHPDPEESYRQLRDVVRRTIKRRGKLIIPAFAVGRTQELVYNLNRMIVEKEIPAIPVFVDSPLAVNTTDVFRQFKHYFDAETQEFVASGKHRALMFDGLTYTRSVQESIDLNDNHEPMVIISASGMAEAGRILHHLKHNIESEQNTIAIVSWQAPNTLGRRLVEGERDIKIFGQRYYRRAEVVSIQGFSAHAGQDLLLEYAAASQDSLEKVILVHGEERGALPLKQLILEKTKIKSVEYPEQFQILEI